MGTEKLGWMLEGGAVEMSSYDGFLNRHNERDQALEIHKQADAIKAAHSFGNGLAETNPITNFIRGMAGGTSFSDGDALTYAAKDNEMGKRLINLKKNKAGGYEAQGRSVAMLRRMVPGLA
jgi:hypothetical protein